MIKLLYAGYIITLLYVVCNNIYYAASEPYATAIMVSLQLLIISKMVLNLLGYLDTVRRTRETKRMRNFSMLAFVAAGIIFTGLSLEVQTGTISKSALASFFVLLLTGFLLAIDAHARDKAPTEEA